MAKKMMMAIATIVFICGFVGMTLAQDQDEGNKRKGKYLYRKVYKSCNERGEIASPKPALNPDAKTQAQWKAIFEKKQFEEFGCKEEWGKLTEEEVKDIFTYLHDHAADSPTPAKCQ